MALDRDALAGDEQQIRDTCMRYWAAVDRNDVELYLSAFTPDAVLVQLGGQKIVSIQDRAREGKLTTHYAFTSHAPASQVILVEGDSATVDTLVVAHLVLKSGPIHVRGLRYLDDLVRAESGWRIRRRQHFALWQYKVGGFSPYPPANREDATAGAGQGSDTGTPGPGGPTAPRT